MDCVNDLAEINAIVGGKEVDFKYKDCKAEMDMVNKAFIEFMIEGDTNGRVFQYPIPTYSMTKNFDWKETENNKLLFERASKYGTPYFSNYVNSEWTHLMCVFYVLSFKTRFERTKKIKRMDQVNQLVQ